MGSSQWGHKAPAPRLRVNRLQSGSGVRQGSGRRTGGTCRRSRLGVVWAAGQGVVLSPRLLFAGARAVAAPASGSEVLPAGEARHRNGVVTQGRSLRRPTAEPRLSLGPGVAWPKSRFCGVIAGREAIEPFPVCPSGLPEATPPARRASATMAAKSASLMRRLSARRALLPVCPRQFACRSRRGLGCGGTVPGSQPPCAGRRSSCRLPLIDNR